MKKIIIAAIACVTCVGGGVTTGVVVNSPEYVMSHAISSAVEEVLEREDLSYIFDVLNQGSVEVNYNAEKNMSFGGKVYFGLEDSKIYVENASININNSDMYFATSANMYISKDMMYIENEDYLDGAYGLKFKKLSEQLKNSLFFNDSKYKIPDEYKDIIEDFVEYYEEDYPKLQKDLNKLYKDYAKKLGKLVKEYGEFDSKNKKVSLSDGKSKKRVVTLTIDEDDAASIVEELIEYIIEDEKLEEFAETHVENLKNMTSLYNVQKENVDVYDEIIDSLKEILDEVDEIKEENFEITLEVVTPKASAKLLKFDVEVDYGDYSSSIGIDFGTKGVKESKNIDLYRDDKKVYSYEIEENNRKKFEANLVVYTGYDDETIEFTYVLDKKKEEFNIKAVVDDIEKMVIKGDALIDGKAITFKPSQFVIKDEDYDYDYDLGKWVTTYEEVDYLENISFEFTISSKDKMPKPNKDFNSILEISESDLDKIIKKIEEDTIN